MHIDIRATDRLTGPKGLDLTPTLNALSASLREATIDLNRLRIVCDWLQYKQNFREPLAIRHILPSALESGTRHAHELAIDLRRTGSMDLTAEFANALNPVIPHNALDGRQYLEDWAPGSASCIWDFNGLYWGALGLWEQATGREYEQALPGGETDAKNTEAADELILELFKVWDGLAARKALPEDLYVLELGVGNGNQAKVWLDEFRRLDREHGGDYYRRLHYLMGDYSAHVLDRARENVKQHAEHVSGLVLDARYPSKTLGFLRSKAFLIYISNVYDNLPTDELVRIGGHLYQVEVRAYLSAAQVTAIAEEFGISPTDLPAMVRRLLDLHPEVLARSEKQQFPGGVMQVVEFWRKVWDAVRLEERYAPIEELDTYELTPGISGEMLRPVVEANGDLRMHTSNGAATSFIDSLALLHPFGFLQCHDIFVTSIEQYQMGFRGPGKYDGSVVNWVNGPLLATLCKRKGFEACISPFQHRSGSNIMTLTARVAE